MRTYFKPIELRCEYETKPMGVHELHPLLSFQCDHRVDAQHQTAYRIVAASSEALLASQQYDCWDSKKVISRQSYGIAYQGKALCSGMRVYWQVQIWDENDRVSAFSDVSFFEMGLLSPSDWNGQWLSFLGGLIGNGLLMRYSFTLDQTPVKARAYLAGVGYCELHLNGEKVGDRVLEPGATDHSKTVLYSTYDVLDNLQAGLNVVGIVFGNGWSTTPKALLQLNVEFADGSTKEVVTDWGIGWCVAKGPILYNSIYEGEIYDARVEKDGWCTPVYEEQAMLEHQRADGWILATIVEPPAGELIGQIMPPIRVTESCTPTLVGQLPSGALLYDAQVNRSGWARIVVQGKRGSQVKLKFAEQLNHEGELDTSYMRTATAEDTYILRGDLSFETYSPRFTYHGFRYFTVETQGDVTVKTLQAQFVRTDVTRNARFTCDHPMLNQLAQVMWNTEASNLHSIPTDCCQRDERHGWTNDATTRVESSIYHFHLASFFEKWVRDIFDTQNEQGYIADTAPYRWGKRPCDPQINTLIGLPLLLYHTYGNQRILQRYYPQMKRYFDVLYAETNSNLIERGGFGEWACPRSECREDRYGAGASSKNVTPALVSTAYLYYSATQLCQIAEILGDAQDEKQFASIATNIKLAYNQRFFDPKTKQYDQHTQSAYAISLALGLVEEEHKQAVVQNLVEKISQKEYHMTTGNTGSKALIEMLCQYGKADIAYQLMTQTTSPSFGYMLRQGATSMWERWEADTDNNVMNSHNQPMFASCAVWFYKYLGGICLPQQGDNTSDLMIKPVFVSELQEVNAQLDIMTGTVVVAWKRCQEGIALTVTLPFNTDAVIVLPKQCRQIEVLDEANVTAVEKPDGYQLTVQHGIHQIKLHI